MAAGDDEFKVRLGRIRVGGKGKPRSFVAQVLRAVNKAGGAGGRPGAARRRATFGRPILRAQERAAEPVAGEPQPASTAQPDPDAQRRQQEIEAARTSRLFVSAETAGTESA